MSSALGASASVLAAAARTGRAPSRAATLRPPWRAGAVLYPRDEGHTLLGANLLAPACNSGLPGTDADVDGWCVSDTPYSDCDDSSSAIKPTAPEDGLDDDDEDCDGSVLINRLYIQPMNTLVDSEMTLGLDATRSTT